MAASELPFISVLAHIKVAVVAGAVRRVDSLLFDKTLSPAHDDGGYAAAAGVVMKITDKVYRIVGEQAKSGRRCACDAGRDSRRR
jgi:hypothetical protein